jgi:hypothetical protein
MFADEELVRRNTHCSHKLVHRDDNLLKKRTLHTVICIWLDTLQPFNIGVLQQVKGLICHLSKNKQSIQIEGISIPPKVGDSKGEHRHLTIMRSSL